jgi:predicted  nucleic acid-binding Zn-ribbon protein
MSIADPLGPVEDPSQVPRNFRKLARSSAKSEKAESSNGGMPAENLGESLDQVSKTSIGQIDTLISELQTLRRKLQTDGDRIQRDITEHVELSQQVMQLTSIISDSVKKLPSRGT